jgi:putative Mn2+ efflux pump MntP
MWALIVLSIALAMDAFAVSLVRGSVGRRSVARAVELGAAFGLAQGLMPLIGWALAGLLGELFAVVDHWIAFILLAILGGRMVMESFAPPDGPAVGDHSRILGLATAAFATSIDAAAAGVTFDLLGFAVPLACLTIGATTALLCTAGYLVGGRVPERLGKRAEFVGGLVLIALGLKILLEHLAA